MTTAQPVSGSLVKPGLAGLILAAAAYAFIAISPVVFYAVVKASSFMSASEVAAFAPGLRYASVSGAIYFGSAVLASVLLCARSRFAVWPAIVIVVWVAGLQLLKLPSLWRGRDITFSLTEAALLAAFAVLAWYVVRLRRRSVLR